MQIANLDLYFVDFDFLNNYKIKVLAGRGFSRDFGTDTTKAMVINEASSKLLGFTSPQEAIGKTFRQWGREGQIIGVVENFHFRSLQEAIKPLSIRIEPTRNSLLTVNVSANEIPATVAAIEKTFATYTSNVPFSYYFLDEFFDRQYRSEQRFGNLFLYFSILAILISCIGLLGLASYSTIQRTKEIGIRKVLGASVTTIINLLSKEFLILVIISFVLASPLAWYFMNEWLKDFAHRIDISWWIFFAAGTTAILIALITISFQALKAAVANPIKSLRTE
jgi:putative ABC transport system permease protein